MTNFSDLPIDNPKFADFGFGDYSKAISDLILTSDTPVSMSISGDWGEGKTSLLNLIQHELNHKDKDNQKHLFIKFDAWKFTFSDNLNQVFLDFILLEIVKSDIINKLNDEEKKSIFSSVVSIVKIGGQVLGGYLKEKTGVEIDLNEIISNGGDFIKNKLVNVKNIRDDFETIVDKILDKYGKDFKIVIAIDDLDRIDSVKAIEIIEIFKNYLNVKGVFFILVIDQEVIENGLIRKFNLTTDKEKKKYEKYFDKIIQIPFNIPEKNNYESSDFNKFLKNIFGDNDFTILFKGEKGKIIKNILTNKNFLKGNPRAIKRYFNIYKLLKNINKNFDFQNLFFIIILQDFNNYQEAYESIKVFEVEDYEEDIKLDKEMLNNIISFDIPENEYKKIKSLTNITEKNEKDEKYIWKEEIINLIYKLDKEEFRPRDLYQYIIELKEKFPNNNSITNKIQQQIQLLRDENYLISLGNGLYRFNKLTEDKLLFFVLKEIQKDPGITTSQIIEKLSHLAKGEDANYLTGRNDTYLSQKIRNLVSHGKIQIYADSEEGIKREGKKWTLNKKGKKYLEDYSN